MILCVGESVDERSSNKHFETVSGQILSALKEIDLDSKKNNIIIAYEPIWAIGTGKIATIQEVSEMHQYIRKLIDETFSKNIASNIKIIYGGSVNSENCKSLICLPFVDGFLVGGASLNAQTFYDICISANSKT